MESINITKAIFKKIIDFLNNKEMIVKYLIKEINDFNNEDKINFYYIFLKLLKDSIFIYIKNKINNLKYYITDYLNMKK